MKKWVLFTIIFILLMPIGSYACCQNQFQKGIIFQSGEDLTIADDQIHKGTILLIGSDLDLKGTQRGSVVLIGGNINLSGSLRGNLVNIGGTTEISGHLYGTLKTIGGDIYLGANSAIQGGIVKMGGEFSRESGSIVTGETLNKLPQKGIWESFWSLYILNKLAYLSLLLILAVLFSIFWSKRIEYLAYSLRKFFWRDLGIGVLILVLFPLIVIGLIISIIGIPVALILPLILTFCIMFGKIGLGLFLGEEILIGLHAKKIPLIWATILGVLIIEAFALIPIFGILLNLIVAFVVLGAIFESRFSFIKK